MQWVKCSDRLPEEGQTVICYRKVIVMGWYCKTYCPYEKKRKGFHCDWDGIIRSTFKTFPVTHWMPLPESPKE